MSILPETELMKVTVQSEDDRTGTYVIGPLSPGYGVTVGNSLRRVLLSSLEGSAVSAVRIEGVTHEFTTLPGMKEDVVELILNLKTMRVGLMGNESATLRLTAKGPGEVRAGQFEPNANVKIVDPNHYLASLDKSGKLELEVLIERGRGYVPTEAKQSESNPLGTISVDSIFTPVKKVHYEVEHTRVGGMTNFDNLIIDLTTDGTIYPREAIAQAAKILIEHLSVVAAIEELPKAEQTAAQEKKTASKTTKKSKADAATTQEATPTAEKSKKKTTTKK